MIDNEIRSKIAKDNALSFAHIGLLLFLLEEDGVHTVSSLALRNKMQGLTLIGNIVKDLVELEFLYRGRKNMIHVNQCFITERYK